MIGTRAVTQFTKFKGTWVGHMVDNNNSAVDTRLPIDGDYREYDTAPYVPGHRGTDVSSWTAVRARPGTPATTTRTSPS
jgi:hypothetical protein